MRECRASGAHEPRCGRACGIGLTTPAAPDARRAGLGAPGTRDRRRRSVMRKRPPVKPCGQAFSLWLICRDMLECFKLGSPISFFVTALAQCAWSRHRASTQLLSHEISACGWNRDAFQRFSSWLTVKRGLEAGAPSTRGLRDDGAVETQAQPLTACRLAVAARSAPSESPV
jgi:hypothetical protein